MKITSDGTVWVEPAVTGHIRMGLTKAGLEKYGFCFVYVPKIDRDAMVSAGSILASMEGTKCLRPLRSPITGKVLDLLLDVQDTPYEITERDALFVFEAGAKLDEKAFA